MPSDGYQHEHTALSKVVEALRNVEDDARERIIKAVATFYDIGVSRLARNEHTLLPHAENSGHVTASREPQFSEHSELSPKQFLEQRQPRSDVERVACLAYYLAHYRDIPHFKTVDISKLNTEAAQFKFSNAALAVNNAAWRGLLTSAGKGHKQISALGERYVAALPDRDSAKKVLEQMRTRRKRGRTRAAKRDAPAAK